jgi:hypothetical protein
MIVISTPRIERLTATWAPGFALHVLLNGEFCAAGAAEDCLLVPLALRPDFDRMIGERGVTVLAGIVDATALHLDRNNVAWPVIVPATSLRIKIYAANLGNSRNHPNPGKKMAEREGFEPPIPVKVCPLSRRIVSTTHAPLRKTVVGRRPWVVGPNSHGELWLAPLGFGQRPEAKDQRPTLPPTSKKSL